MKLFGYEVKKTLLIQKGILIILVCLMLKALVLGVFPERKDMRIKLSQIQYDQYLEQLHGPNTAEKSQFIFEDHEKIVRTIAMQDEMKLAHNAGEISEEEWEAYIQDLSEANLHENASDIFTEKAEQFAEQPWYLPPGHYIYEYGWQTIYTLLYLPDVFLLLGILLMTAQSFTSEVASGMLPVLLAAKEGRKRLFYAKLASLLVVSLGAAVLSGGLEWMIFSLRGFMHDGNAPLYSITIFADCPLDVTLQEGFFLALALRTIGALLFAAMFYAISFWIKATPNLLFMALCVLIVPMFVSSAPKLFTHAGLLSSTQGLTLLGKSGIAPILPILVVGAYSLAAVILAQFRHQKGL